MINVMVRGISRWYLTSRGATRWIRRRFTTVGFALLIGLAITLGTANHEQTMGFPTFLLLATVLLIALAVAPFFRVRFAVSRQAPHLVTAGKAFMVRVQITNLGAHPQIGLDYAEELHEPRITSQHVVNSLREALTWRPQNFGGANLSTTTRPARCAPVPLPLIPVEATREVEVTITAWRRGPLHLAGGVVMRTDLFGVFRSFSRVVSPQTILVLPARYPLPPLELPGQSREQPEGAALATGAMPDDDQLLNTTIYSADFAVSCVSNLAYHV